MSIVLELDWTGSGLWQILIVLDWIQTVKCFINGGSGADLNWVNGKELRNSFCEELRIAAINLFQFDLDKPWNCPQYCNEKGTSAPFWKSRGICPSHFPAFRRPYFSHSIKLFGLLLSAVTVSLHYLPRCLRSTATGGKTHIAATWREPLKNCCCHVIDTQ